MKKTTTIITLVAFLFFGLTAIAQKSTPETKRSFLKKAHHNSVKSKKTDINSNQFQFSKGQISKPGNSEEYYWDAEANDWQHSSNTVYSYNETGQLLEQIATEANTGINLHKESYAFDEHGNTTEEKYYYWNNEEWELNYGNKHVYTYDNNGNITSQVYQWWDFQTSTWLNDWKDISVYDNNGHLSEMIYQDWENEAWLNGWKDVLTVNASGIPTELMNYEWEGNDWVPSEKYTDITWNSWSGWEDYGSEPSSYTGQEYDNGQWVNYERYNAIYSGNNYVGTYEVWENGAWMNSDRETVTRSATEEINLYELWENGQWVKSYQDTETYDDHGNSTGYKYEYWENGEWVIEYAVEMSHTYNNDGDITETIFSQWDYESMSMVNYERKVYSNFQHFESGINNLNSLTNVSIYPNPVAGSINIQIDETDVNSYQVEIINLTGQTIYTNAYSNLSTSINVENLNSGLYFIRITTDNKKLYNYKFMKD